MLASKLNQSISKCFCSSTQEYTTNFLFERVFLRCFEQNRYNQWLEQMMHSCCNYVSPTTRQA